ncbi:MAG: tRNA 2-methylthio-N6-isopentenyl adenosine(37) hydroxylase MiaE [Candidatus Sumerlaeia bacterium]|nr:tRNA 2-methylthio-N6-isopentenyl adenosine(37) hydroxylase MiaE [Candidatus Sumerlaeia bacterium]
MAPKDDLPLKYQTPMEWGPLVMRDPLSLLNDHAHLERKAATNALELLLRWPTPNPPENWVHSMTSISVDEAGHLNTVTRLLARRGGALTKKHRNQYAAELRRLVRIGHGDRELLDRLLVSALIEARSCERFHLLAMTSGDEELSRLYEGLYRSEAGHFRVFLALARDLPEKLDVETRWQEMLNAEAEIITSQPHGPSMHSGMPA